MLSWLTKESREKTRKLFEKKYGRKLSDKEVEEISLNLATFIGHVLKFNERITKKSKI